MKGDTCRIGGCTNTVTAKKGLVCGMHMTRFWRHRDYNYISPNWTVLKKGKPELNGYGYYRMHNGCKRVLLHRHLMEQHLGRKLRKNESIHHINGIKTDNRLENLIVLTQSKHISKYHHKKTLVDWSKYNITDPREFNRWHTCPIKVCVIDNCSEKTKYASLCGKHYQSYRHNFLKK